ncbi:MAG: AMP-dependent synthetase [Alphaproteobacteria bacterium]|nr:MAG: AMP-dependent synthetase [Alphaproteobacteria bacterium]
MFRAAEDIIASSTLRAFLDRVGAPSYEALAERAVADPDWFWAEVVDWAGIRLARPWERIRDASAGPEATRWAVGAELDMTETLLDAHLAAGRGDHPAVDWTGGNGERRVLSYAELAALTNQVANALDALGVGPGDAVGLHMPMIPEIVAGFLGIARLGAVVVPLFSGFAPQAIRSRLGDARAKAVLTVDAAIRRDVPLPMETVLEEAIADLDHVEKVISLRRFDGPRASDPRVLDWADTVGRAATERAPRPMPSDAPALIIYTSGTTGKPKGVVHNAFGLLCKTAVDLRLAMDLRPEDRQMWMTDMGWMIGPFTLIGDLQAGATMVIAEGAPSTPKQPFRVMDIVAERGVSHFGVAPTLIRQFMAFDRSPLDALDLSALRIVGSSGEPWTDDAWIWHLDHICRRRAVPINISGGTELFGAIVTSTVLHEIKPCGFSAEALGSGAKVFRDDGTEAAPGEVGELVVTRPFPGMTPTIWGDHQRYLETYWSTFPGVWRHGDWARRDPDGTWYILGRSDDTLNVAGKRIGPAEIESALTGTGKVLDAAVVGLPDPIKGTAVVAVCVPAPGVTPSEALVAELKEAVAREVSKPFRPRDVHFVAALPKTRSMKTMRRVVRAALLGEDPGDLTSLMNPESVPPLRELAQAG